MVFVFQCVKNGFVGLCRVNLIRPYRPIHHLLKSERPIFVHLIGKFRPVGEDVEPVALRLEGCEPALRVRKCTDTAKGVGQDFSDVLLVFRQSRDHGVDDFFPGLVAKIEFPPEGCAEELFSKDVKILFGDTGLPGIVPQWEVRENIAHVEDDAVDDIGLLWLQHASHHEDPVEKHRDDDGRRDRGEEHGLKEGALAQREDEGRDVHPHHENNADPRKYSFLLHAVPPCTEKQTI